MPSRNDRRVHSTVLWAVWTVVGLNPLKLFWARDRKVCGTKRFACLSDLHTGSRYCTRGGSEDCTGEKACKESTLVLKPRANVTRSLKQGYQWPPKRTYVIQKFDKKPRTAIRKDHCNESLAVDICWCKNKKLSFIASQTNQKALNGHFVFCMYISDSLDICSSAQLNILILIRLGNPYQKYI